MNIEKLTTKSREALLAATQMAKEHHHGSVLPEHLTLALLGQQEGIVYPLLDKLGLSALDIRRSLESTLDTFPKVYGDADIEASHDLSKALSEADNLRSSMGDDYLSVEHLILAIADTFGSDKTTIAGAINEIRGNRRGIAESAPARCPKHKWKGGKFAVQTFPLLENSISGAPLRLNPR